MHRRNVLRLAATAATLPISACLPARAAQTETARPRSPIRAIAFDLFTIFDPTSVVPVAESLFPGRGPEFTREWRRRQFEYAWLRATAERYQDFGVLSADALAFAADTLHLDLDAARTRRLLDANEQLDPWPDTRAALERLSAAGIRLAPLSNFTPAMLTRMVDRAGLGARFERLLSTDAVRTFKPHPRAYQLAVDALALPREQIVFAAFGGWDAAGARWFGFPTFWVNRLGAARERLDAAENAVGRDLADLATWVLG